MLTNANMGYLVGRSNDNVSITLTGIFHSCKFKINFEEDRDFVELDRSPSKFDMPLTDDSLDEYLLGNQE